MVPVKGAQMPFLAWVISMEEMDIKPYLPQSPKQST
jgi:hypothetical protein